MNVGFGPLVHVCIKAHLFCVSAQILVPGSTTTALLQQLLPNTDYNVGVVALYSDGEGPAVSDEGKTCKNPGRCVLLAALRCFQQKCKNMLFFPFLRSVPRSAPRNLRVYDPTTTTLSVNWDHADGPVMEYRITYAQITGDPIEAYVSIFIIRQRCFCGHK